MQLTNLAPRCAVLVLALSAWHPSSSATGRAAIAPGARPGVDTVRFETREATRLAFDVSPDGRSIVFDLLGQLWRVPSAGGDAVPITDAVRDTAEDFDPVISPDGRRIVFQGDRPGGRALWVMPAAGGAPRKLTSRFMEYFTYASPSWSPDGRRVAYAVGDTMAVLDVDAGTETVLRIDSLPAATPAPGFTPRNGSPSWSPDGARLVFVNTAANQVRGDGRLWEVPATGGVGRPIAEARGLAPAWSPDGATLAFFARDSSGRWQLWTRSGDEAPRRLTNHEEVVTYRVRWMPDGRSLVYSADGGLWRVPREGGTPTAIPFRARVTIPRRRATLRPIRFPVPGAERTAKGFTSIALSPDGRRLAMVALDSLWVGTVNGPLRSVAQAREAGDNALTWSPGGDRVAWTRRERPGRPFELVVSDVRSGERRTLVTLAQDVTSPTWSPDGKWIAFLAGGRLRLADPRGEAVAGAEKARDLGPANVGLGGLAWSPRSDAVVVAGHDFAARRLLAFWVPLEGERRPIARFPRSAASLALGADGRAVWVEDNRLMRGAFDGPEGLRDTPVPLSDDPALEARHAADGKILYLSVGGLRLRDAKGDVKKVAWPLRYRVPAAPAPVLVRGARVIDGRGAPASPPRDVLLQDGRIARIADAGTLSTVGVRVVDASGGWLLPGFIDLHAHIWDDLSLVSWLHNGVTTIRDIASEKLKTPDTRNAIEAGRIEGPRIVYGGAMFNGMGSGYSSLADQMNTDSGSIARAMAILSGLDVGFVKERAFDSWWRTQRVVEEAHRYGITVSGHCEHILPVVAAGVDGVEHILDCTRDRFTMRSDYAELARAAGLWIVPTAALRWTMVRAAGDSSLVDAPDVAPFLVPQYRGLYAGEGARRNAPVFTPGVQRIQRAIGRYHNSGVTVATGTDSPFPLGLQHEMEVFVESGMSPMQAIVAATGAAARVLNAPEIGTIAEGQWADLVLLGANPLDDIRNTRAIREVIQGGRLIDREGLRRKGIVATTK